MAAGPLPLSSAAPAYLPCQRDTKSRTGVCRALWCFWTGLIARADPPYVGIAVTVARAGNGGWRAPRQATATRSRNLIPDAHGQDPQCQRCERCAGLGTAMTRSTRRSLRKSGTSLPKSGSPHRACTTKTPGGWSDRRSSAEAPESPRRLVEGRGRSRNAVPLTRQEECPSSGPQTRL